MTMYAQRITIAVALLLSCTAAAEAPKESSTATASGDNGKPNIIFILTDDQDKHLHSMKYMQAVQKQIIAQGTSFENHYCTTALCCPSRVSLLTGRLAHNTNVTTLDMPYGGYNKFANEGLADKWLAPWLQDAGYKTYYTGKLMNDHSRDNYNKPYPGGLDGHDFLIGPGTYSYLHPLFQRNHDKPNPMSGYATDILKTKSLGFIDEGAASNKPFFLMIATVAPHSSSDKGHDDDDTGEPEAEASGAGNAPIPAPRHAHLFTGTQVNRTKNYNPKKASGASWVRKLPRMSDSEEKANDVYYVRRLQALQAVDELVGGVIDKLEKLKILDNTYVIYSTDNGFHIGNHRLNPGKRCPYEEDVNIPLAIRGPGIAKGKVDSQMVTSHTDLVPTILDWAGAKHPDNLDGVALPIGKAGGGDGSVWEHTQVEHWGNGAAEGTVGRMPQHKGGYKTNQNTYKAVRVINPAQGGYNLYYAVWCDGDHELYDMVKDSQQMENLYKGSGGGGNAETDDGDDGSSVPRASANGKTDTTTTDDENLTVGGLQVPLKKLEGRLDTLLLLLKDCKKEQCVRPWDTILPGKGVKTLKDALAPEHDTYFQNQRKKVKFERCTQGYVPEFEGPQF